MIDSLHERGMSSSSSKSQSTSRSVRSYESPNKFRQISPKVLNHLKLVYLSLGCALIASAFGVYLHLIWNIGNLQTAVACFGSISCLRSMPAYEEKKRVSLLMAAAFFLGACIGPLIDRVIQVDPGILISGFVGTAIAFGCFSAAAMLAKCREYLYLGGLLSSGLSILFWLDFASSRFRGSTAIFQFKLYFGLLLFLGYIVVDTQEIIERAHLGDLDYVKHSLTLFVDFAAVFVRILIIMLNYAFEKDEKKRKRMELKINQFLDRVWQDIRNCDPVSTYIDQILGYAAKE